MSKRPPRIDSWKEGVVEAAVSASAPPPPYKAILDTTTDEMLNRVRLIVAREIATLDEHSKMAGLSKDESQILINFSKELREWKKEEKASLDEMSEEELAAIAANETNSTTSS